MSEQNEAVGITTPEAEFMDVVFKQAADFEEGFGTVIDGALKGGIHPMAISIACIRAVGRIAAAVSIGRDLSPEQWESIVMDLVKGVVADMKDGYSVFNDQMKAQKEAGVAA